MEQAEIISQLVTVAPVVGVLIYFIIYFRKKEEGYKTDIKELNSELRETERESISVMKDLNVTLEKLIEKLS